MEYQLVEVRKGGWGGGGVKERKMENDLRMRRMRIRRRIKTIF
jgi:hypothetical protein